MLQPLDLTRHRRIKDALRARGTSLAAIAKELNVSRTTITCVSQGYRRSSRVEAAIANALNTSPQELWPERYKEESKT